MWSELKRLLKKERKNKKSKDCSSYRLMDVKIIKLEICDSPGFQWPYIHLKPCCNVRWQLDLSVSVTIANQENIPCNFSFIYFSFLSNQMDIAGGSTSMHEGASGKVRRGGGHKLKNNIAKHSQSGSTSPGATPLYQVFHQHLHLFILLILLLWYV